MKSCRPATTAAVITAAAITVPIAPPTTRAEAIQVIPRVIILRILRAVTLRREAAHLIGPRHRSRVQGLPSPTAGLPEIPEIQRVTFL